MATTIDAVSVVAGRPRLRSGGLALADAAARAALARAGLAAGDVELLVNTGLYHDRLLGEPALAALIQEDIGANPEDPHPDGHGTFSFDLANGGCGMLTGLQVVDGFLRAGTVQHAVVVASDATPGRRLAQRFPFAPAGAAMVCGWEDGPHGLAGFRFATAAADGGGLRATTGQRPDPRLRIERAPDLDARAGAWAAEVAARLLDSHGLGTGDIDVVVANPLTPAFLAALAEGLGIDRARVVSGDGRDARVHTAALGVAWARATEDQRLASGSTALLVSAGAGLTAGACLAHL